MELSPSVCAGLAEDIYFVEDVFELKGILSKRPELSQEEISKNVLTASVGMRSKLLNTNTSFGLCIRGAGAYKNDLFVIIRGTTFSNFGADIVTDIRAGMNISATGSVVHAGFNQAFNSLKSGIANFLHANTDAINVHCIGHSLGGAVASLAADWITDNFSKNVKLYTFGCPRIGFGLTGFAGALTRKLLPENIYRAYHYNDVVPMVPVFPFTHAPTQGHSCCLPFKGMFANINAHRMANYISSVGGKKWAQLRMPSPLTVSKRAVQFWLESDTVDNLHDISVWHRINFVLGLIAQAVVARFQAPIIGALTIADYLAMVLEKALDISSEMASWVLLLVRRLMRMLGMKAVETIEQVTRALLRFILNQIVSRMNRMVKNAIDQMR